MMKQQDFIWSARIVPRTKERPQTCGRSCGKLDQDYITCLTLSPRAVFVHSAETLL